MTTTPLTDQQLAAIRDYHERTTHPDWREDTHVGQLLGEIDRLAAELGRVRAELATAQQRIDSVLALHIADRDELEQMDPEQYHHADGYGDAIFAVQVILTDPVDPAAAVPSA